MEKEIGYVKWDDIKNANDLIQTINLKGKEYAEVKERVIAFRRVYPMGQIITELSYTENYVNCEATIVANESGCIIAKGHSREYLKREFAVEKSETSAVGRALGFCGFGINTSIASAEDIQSVDTNVIFDELTPKEIENLKVEFFNIYEGREQANILNGLSVKTLDDLDSNLLKLLVEHGKKQTD